MNYKITLVSYYISTVNNFIILCASGKEDPDAPIRLQFDDNGVLQFLYFATSVMKAAVDKYPEILMIDGTYCINKLRMPLYTFLVMDSNGHGRTGAYCFVSDEKKATIETIIRTFAEVNDTSKIKTVITDKDFNEIAAIKAILPSVKVQICRFHVLQALQREIRKMKGSQDDRNGCMGVLKELVYTRSEENFTVKEHELKSKASPEFYEYYLRCWASCKQSWAAHLLNDNINLGTFSNNRLESHNQKIKMVLDRHTSLADAVSGLLRLNDNVSSLDEQIAFKQNMKLTYRIGDNDAVLEDINATCTLYVASLIREELLEARKRQDELARDNCDCIIKKTMMIPCKHLFANRLRKNQTVFHSTDVADRWLKTYSGKSNSKNRIESRATVSNDNLAPLSKTEKYKEAMTVCKNLADFLSYLGTRELREKLDSLNMLLGIWMSGKHALVVQSTATEGEGKNVNNVTNFQNKWDMVNSVNVEWDAHDAMNIGPGSVSDERCVEQEQRNETYVSKLVNFILAAI